jgi:hypothetical protein
VSIIIPICPSSYFIFEITGRLLMKFSIGSIFLSCGLRHRVVWQLGTNVSEEHTTTIFRIHPERHNTNLDGHVDLDCYKLDVFS